MAVLAFYDLAASLAVDDSGFNFGGNCPFINASRLGWQADTVGGVGVTTGAAAFVDAVEACEVAAGVTPFAVPEDEIGAV